MTAKKRGGFKRRFPRRVFHFGIFGVGRLSLFIARVGAYHGNKPTAKNSKDEWARFVVLTGGISGIFFF